jgi:hypothetical protein
VRYTILLLLLLLHRRRHQQSDWPYPVVWWLQLGRGPGIGLEPAAKGRRLGLPARPQGPRCVHTHTQRTLSLHTRAHTTHAQRPHVQADWRMGAGAMWKGRECPSICWQR